MVTRDEAIQAAFAAIDRHLRCASIAEIGGLRPTDAPVTSYFGGQFVGVAGEAWPLSNGVPMIPLLQVRTDELPHCPAALDGIALLNIFIGTPELPLDLPAENGDGWLLRSYPTLDGLDMLSPPGGVGLRPFPVRWHRAEAEGPQWQDAWGLHDLTALNELEDAIDLFYDRYSRHHATKVGGWPSYIQASVGTEDYVLQIGSEQKPRWMWGDAGTGYFSVRDGKWYLYWDCY